MPIKDIILLEKDGDYGMVVLFNNNIVRRYCTIWESGDKHYYVGSIFHRDDGPAIENADGSKEWWLFGERLPCNSDEEFNKYLKNKAFW